MVFPTGMINISYIEVRPVKVHKLLNFLGYVDEVSERYSSISKYVIGAIIGAVSAIGAGVLGLLPYIYKLI